MRRLFNKHLALAALIAGAVLALPAARTAVAQTSGKKPNILVIMTDDVGVWNISAYHRGLMGGGERLTSTASPMKGRSSPTTMPSRAARRAAPLSSRGSIPSEPVF
jgi:hypothetical protein